MFISIECAGRFSIGTADNVQQEMKALQANSAEFVAAPAEFRLLCAVRLEKPARLLTSLHQQYEAKRLLNALSGDVPAAPALGCWFTLTRQEANELSSLLLQVYFEERRQIYLRHAQDLPAVLAWKVKTLGFDPPFGFVWEGARLNTDRGYQNYAVEFDPAFSPQTKATVHHWNNKRTSAEQSCPAHEGESLICWYNSVAEAKAACETHATSGKFPLSVRPVLLSPIESLAPGNYKI